MIVGAATFRDGRISWPLDAEPGDDAPPCPELWVEGLVRPLAPAVEALWLALAVAGFARDRIILPCPAPSELRIRSEAVLGVAIAAEAAAAAAPGEFAASLLRDPLDAMLSGMLRDSSNFAIACTSDPLGPGAAPADIRLASNAGAMRRRHQPLDRLGELATALLLAPGLSLCRMTAFLCGDEFGGIGTIAFTELATAAGVELVLPLADVRTRQLGDFATALNLPAIVAIRTAWQRYRMHPEVMAAIYRKLYPALADGGVDEPIVRICCYYVAQSAPPETGADGRFDLSAFHAQP